MAPEGRRLSAVPVLVALIAVLLPAGAFAAATVDAGHPPRGPARVGAAGFGGELLADDQSRPVAPTVTVTSTVAPAPPVTATVPKGPAPTSKPTPTVPGRTATTASPGTALFPTPPGFPPLPMPTFPPNPPASSWSKTANGITVRMHIEPATPVAGRPVTFVIDQVTAPVHCCVIHFSPEIDVLIPMPGANGPNPEMGICGSPPVTRSGLSHTHTFAAPGVYPIFLMVLTSQCQMPAVGGPSSASEPSMLDLLGCVTVGPASAIRPETIPPRCTGP